MNLVSVSDAKGQLLPYARHILDALAFFPEDELSYLQIKELLALEFAWIDPAHPEAFNPSMVTSAVMNYAANRSQQVYVCGLVILAMRWLLSQGRQPSQNAACELVGRHAALQNDHPFIFYDARGAEFVEKGKSVPSDAATVRQIFTKYRRAAHICAARISCSAYLEPIAPTAHAPVADACYLATVVKFQSFLANRSEAKNWDLRLVSYPPGLFGEAHPLFPPDDMLSDLFEGGS
ncbi:MAG: hypothetical protein AAF914_06470 [Pseudomonadota bacterium]